MFDSIPELNAIPRLCHVMTNRLGGVSTDGFASLNIAYHVGDDPACVTENRRRLARAVGYDPASLIAAQQVHGTKMALVGVDDRGRGAFSWESAIPETDGLIVVDSGVPVMIQVADCAPVLIVDPVQHILAVVHAGWRGALGRITSQAVGRMVQEAGTDPTDCLVGIGPTLCPDCLEVGEEVATAVEAEFTTTVALRNTEKPHLHLRAMITEDARNAGIDPERIYVHEACTRCANDRFFSHRGQQGTAGRFAVIAWWNQ